MIGIGIDVSKGKSTVAIINSEGELILRPTEFQHNQLSLQKLIDLINSFKDDHRIVMEATGHFHYPILNRLNQEGFFLHVVNPYLMKKYSDNEISKGKTDKKDSIKIAKYALEKCFTMKRYEAVDMKYDELRFLSRQYNQMISMKVKSKVQLSNLLDEIMPGIRKLFLTSSISPEDNRLYSFIEEFEHFDLINMMGEKRFISKYLKWVKKVGYRNGAKKSTAIYELAHNSIPTRPHDSTTCLAVAQCLSVLRQNEIACNEIISQMQSVAYTLPEYATVRAMKGVGDKLAPRLIAEIGDVRRFYNAKALNAYAGNDAPPYQSGQFEGTRRHISKRGLTSLRKAGYEVMKCLKTTKPTEDNAVYLFMLKKEAEGKPKNVAKMAALNKFLRIYYARVMELY